MSWQDVLDIHLIEIGRNLRQFDHRCVSPPTMRSVMIAVSLMQDFERSKAPEPTDVYIDSYGGIVFCRDLDESRRLTCTVASNGSVEYLLVGCNQPQRRVIPSGKTSPIDFWIEWSR